MLLLNMTVTVMIVSAVIRNKISLTKSPLCTCNGSSTFSIILPTTIVLTIRTPPSKAFIPTRILSLLDAIIVKTSGEPFPKANNVTPAKVQWYT